MPGSFSLIATALGLALGAAALAEKPVPTPVELTPHEAEYKVRFSGISGRLTTRLARDPVGYTATHQIEPRGIAAVFTSGDMRETSTFGNLDSGLLPVRYRARDTLVDDSETELDFEWREQRVTGLYREEDEQITLNDALEGAVFDRVSIQYRLMHDLARGVIDAGNAGEDGAEYTLIEIDERKPLRVTFVGNQRVRTGAGRYDTIGIQHQAEGSSRRVTLWLAPELDYLPVLIEQHKRDKLRVRATLDEYRPLSPTE